MAIVKAIVATGFLLIVLLTLRHPISIAVGVADLALIPFFVWLAKRHPRAAAYGLTAQTALFLTPRQFVQGYVNGVNWPIYIALPLIAGYVLMERRAALIGGLLTGLIAAPVMLFAALTLPPGITRADVLTLVAFVIGLIVAVAIIAREMIAAHPPGS
ncbi:MAG: hypothetical protein RMN52_10525 [Anaerolineae bacterium]|nr:hypothetical protein [Candidatus Roseilinea sp.]MDW8450430.1 hypothetical protein [Anaerolineae bacterium]